MSYTRRSRRILPITPITPMTASIGTAIHADERRIGTISSAGTSRRGRLIAYRIPNGIRISCLIP